jgi:hypothetical protein
MISGLLERAKVPLIMTWDKLINRAEMPIGMKNRKSRLSETGSLDVVMNSSFECNDGVAHFIKIGSIISDFGRTSRTKMILSSWIS